MKICDAHNDFLTELKNDNEKIKYIGTDFYGTQNLPINLKRYNHFIVLKKHLKNYSFASNIINKVFYKNFLKFYKRINKKY